MTKYHKIYALSFAALLASCSGDITDTLANEPEAAQQTASINVADCEKGELLIKFVPEMSNILDQLSSATGVRKAAAKRQLPGNEEILQILGQYDIERVFPLDPRTEERTRQAGLHLWYKISFDENVNLQEAYTKLSQLGDIQKLQGNRTIHPNFRNARPIVVSEAGLANNAPARAAASGLPFNDPQLFRQWHLINRGGQPFQQEWAPSIAGCDLGCEEAWKLSTGDPDIIVAVLDEGVMYNHPDLIDNMWVNEGEVSRSQVTTSKTLSEYCDGEDNDNNGYKDDVFGYNFVTNSGIINPYGNSNVGHGTHVAGIIAAAGNNGIGCSGVAGGNGSGNGVRIMSLQIIDGNGACTLLMEAKAMKYAADNGAQVIQCSWGYNSALADQIMGYTPGPSTEKEWADLYPLEKESIDYFINNAGSADGVIDGGIAVFASGNEYSAMPAFPSAYSRCVCVSSIAADYTPSTFTNYGEAVTFSAPGGDSDYYGTPGIEEKTYNLTGDEEVGEILSTLIIDEQPTYGYYEGTSMACPAVSGVVALGLSYAKQNCRHFTPEQFIQLMKETSHNLDQYYTGRKMSHYYHTMPGTTTRLMELANYRGKMGTLPDAGALLKAIKDGGSAMQIPNIFVAKGADVKLNLASYFVDGKTLTYSAKVANESIATATVSGSTLNVHGVGIGSTTADIAVGGKVHRITITVRNSTGGYGWF